MLRRLSHKSEFAGFVVAGGISAVCNFLSRILLSNFVSYPVAIVLAYLVGMLTAFILMRSHVFRLSRKRIDHQVMAFVTVNMLSVLQTLAVSLAFAWYLLPWFGVERHVETLAHAVGMVVPIASSYILHKRWTFRAG